MENKRFEPWISHLKNTKRYQPVELNDSWQVVGTQNAKFHTIKRLYLANCFHFFFFCLTIIMNKINQKHVASVTPCITIIIKDSNINNKPHLQILRMTDQFDMIQLTIWFQHENLGLPSSCWWQVQCTTGRSCLFHSSRRRTWWLKQLIPHLKIVRLR